MWDSHLLFRREFNRDWTESFTFICNLDDLPTCLICYKKLAYNKKSKMEGDFTKKHRHFASKYPADVEQIKAIGKLQKQKHQVSSMLSNWTQSTNNVNLESFVVLLEITKNGKPFTGGKYVNIASHVHLKNCFMISKTNQKSRNTSKLFPNPLKRHRIEYLKGLQM